MEQNHFHVNIRKEILKIGNEEVFLDSKDDRDIPLMTILVSEEDHIPGKSENLIMTRLEKKHAALSAKHN